MRKTKLEKLLELRNITKMIGAVESKKIIKMLNDQGLIMIELGGKKGGYAIISYEDYDLVNKYNWHKNKRGYARGICGDDKKLQSMHRFIMKTPEDMVVDHINHNCIDNRRFNLRNVSNLINSSNRQKSKNKKSSKYKGISYKIGQNKFQATTTFNNKHIHIGVYKTENDALTAYELYIAHNFEDDICIGKLNFPEKLEEYRSMEYIPNIKKVPKSKYIGVGIDKSKYYSAIKIKKKVIYTAYGLSEIECAKAYDKYIIDNNIPYKKLNFPNDYPNYDPNYIVKTLYEDVDESTIRLIINNYDDLYVMIDRDDYDKVKNYKLNISNNYIKININKNVIPLHRYILNVTDSKIFVDHIDNNPHNNTKNNLRLSNAKLNPQNKSKQENTSSIYIGIKKTKYNTWLARIKKDGKKLLHIIDKNEKIAAIRRDIFILEKLKDDHYKLNFEWDKKSLVKWKNKLKKIDDSKEGKTSSYIGVYFSNSRNRWIASVKKNKKNVFKSSNTNELHAAIKRDLYILLVLKDKTGSYCMNFEWTNEEIAKWKKRLNLEW
jgi:hypothetical protein